MWRHLGCMKGCKSSGHALRRHFQGKVVSQNWTILPFKATWLSFDWVFCFSTARCRSLCHHTLQWHKQAGRDHGCSAPHEKGMLCRSLGFQPVLREITFVFLPWSSWYTQQKFHFLCRWSHFAEAALSAVLTLRQGSCFPCSSLFGSH